MKQIQFNHELINTPGIVVKYRDGSQPDFVKVYTGVIRSIDVRGGTWRHVLSGGIVDATIHPNDLLMYRQPRTAEEVAREVYEAEYRYPEMKKVCPSWDSVPEGIKSDRIMYVQAGMDEVKGIN